MLLWQSCGLFFFGWSQCVWYFRWFWLQSRFWANFSRSPGSSGHCAYVALPFRIMAHLSGSDSHSALRTHVLRIVFTNKRTAASLRSVEPNTIIYRKLNVSFARSYKYRNLYSCLCARVHLKFKSCHNMWHDSYTYDTCCEGNSFTRISKTNDMCGSGWQGLLAKVRRAVWLFVILCYIYIYILLPFTNCEWPCCSWRRRWPLTTGSEAGYEHFRESESLLMYTLYKTWCELGLRHSVLIWYWSTGFRGASP